MDGIVARHVFKDLFSYFIYCLLAYIFKFGCLIIAINFLGCVVNRFFTNAAGFLISAVMILTAPDALALSACQAWYAGADKNNYGDPRSACLAWLPFADFGRGLKFLRADLAYPGEPDRGAKCMVTGPNGGVEWAEYNAAIRNLDCPILPPDPPCLTCPCPNDGPAEGLATPNPIVPAVAEKIRIDTDIQTAAIPGVSVGRVYRSGRVGGGTSVFDLIEKNSGSSGLASGFLPKTPSIMGEGWSSTLEAHLYVSQSVPAANSSPYWLGWISVSLGDGRYRVFKPTDTGFEALTVMTLAVHPG